MNIIFQKIHRISIASLVVVTVIGMFCMQHVFGDVVLDAPSAAAVTTDSESSKALVAIDGESSKATVPADGESSKVATGTTESTPSSDDLSGEMSDEDFNKLLNQDLLD